MVSAPVVALGCWFGLDEGGKLLQWRKDPARLSGPAAGTLFVEIGHGDEPILVTDMGVYFDAFHRWPHELTARLVNIDERPPSELVPLRLLQPLVPGVRVERMRTYSQAPFPSWSLRPRASPAGRRCRH